MEVEMQKEIGTQAFKQIEEPIRAKKLKNSNEKDKKKNNEDDEWEDIEDVEEDDEY